MPITLVGLAMSTCGRRALMALEETGIPYTLQPVNFSISEHKTPEYQAKHQPFSKYLLYMMITSTSTKYIADKYDKTGKLDTTDPKKRALVEQWISVETSYYNAAEKLVGETRLQAYVWCQS
jgi:glutathione S-transferase